jgi:SAM-dependent methyltransferase
MEPIRLTSVFPDDPAAALRRRRERLSWEGQWSRPDYAPPWLGREVSREIVEAVDGGWFPAGAAAIDIGCGQGEVAAWMAARGFHTVGIDIAPAAIARARHLHADTDVTGKLDFLALDICAQPPPNHQYPVIIDRGCLHQIPLEDGPRYLANILAVTAPGARMLLFMKAFRDGIPLGDAADEARVLGLVHEVLGAHFTILRHASTFLDRDGGSDAARALGGIVLWLSRRS